VQDDTIGALVRFYGPMFLVWAFASFRAAQQQDRFLAGVATGAAMGAVGAALARLRSWLGAAAA
jgi:hypothetical protein